MGWTVDNKVDDVPNISGYTIASVLMQFLALMCFFLALVAFMNGSIIAGIILLAIGAVWEILFVKLVKKIGYRKKQDVKVVADPPAEDFYEPLYKNNGGYFMEDEVKESARRFVKEYYEGAYREDVIKFAKDKLNAELYGFPFRWEDYDAFKVHIDEAFERYGG